MQLLHGVSTESVLLESQFYSAIDLCDLDLR